MGTKSLTVIPQIVNTITGNNSPAEFPDGALRLRFGIVVSLDTSTTCTVSYGGTTVSDVGWIGSSPSVGACTMLQQGRLLLVVGNVTGSGGGGGTSTSTVFNVKDYGAVGDGVTDDTAAILAAHTAMGGVGTLYFPAGEYLVTSLPTFEKATESILGDGSGNTIFLYNTNSTCLLWQNNPLTVAQQGIIYGITIRGSSGAAAMGIHFYDTGTLPELHDLVVENFTGTGGIGIKMENGALWNERASGARVELNNNTIGMQLTSSGSFNSFFYHRWSDLRFNVNAGQIGIQTAGTALLQGGNWNILCNIGGNGGILWDLAGTSVVGGWIYVSGEQTAGTGGITRRFSGGLWAASGMCVLNGCIDSGSVSTNLWSPFEIGATGHILSLFPAAPTAAVGPAAGTSPPAASIGGNDIRGTVGSGTGSATAAGNLVTVTFNQPYIVTPYITITALGIQGAFYRPFISAASTTSFTIALADPPATGLAAASIAFFYQVSG